MKVFTLGPAVARGDIPALCEQLSTLLGGADVVVCDVSAITRPDAAVVEALARLVLTARRQTGTIEIRYAHRRLLELIAFAGLSGVLPDRSGSPSAASDAPSRTGLQGEPEQREQPLDVQELVEPPDPAG